MKRTKSNSLCTRSYSQSTISKYSKEKQPEHVTRHLIIYAEFQPVRGAGANQISRTLRKWEEPKLNRELS